MCDDDGGMQYWQQLGQLEEYEAWLKDEAAQAEYKKFLETLNERNNHAMEG